MRLNPAARTLEFNMAEAAPITITLHDAKGALAAVLFDGNAAKGTNTAAFSPAAARGTATHGVFFVKFAVRGGSAFREMTLLD